jgi:hypothetical protein
MIIYEPEHSFCVVCQNNPVDHFDMIEALGRIKVGDPVVVEAAGSGLSSSSSTALSSSTSNSVKRV